MNREQCKAIMMHIELIKHFAEGGDIGHQAPDCTGKMMSIWPAKGIGLQGLRSDGGTYYLMLKPKYKYNNYTKQMDRITRCWPETVSPDDVIKCKGDDE